MSDANDNTSDKTCSKCKRELPSTSEYFHNRKQSKDGFHDQCKECRGYTFGVRQFTPAILSSKDGFKVCAMCKKEHPSTSDYFYKKPKGQNGLDAVCKACFAIRKKTYGAKRSRKSYTRKSHRSLAPERNRAADQIWRNSNREKKRESDRLYRQKNRENLLEKGKQFRRSNPGKYRGLVRQWLQDNPEKARLYIHRYKARKRALPDTLTAQEWQYAIECFNGCCAVCGRQFNDLFGTHTLAADHWIPLVSPDCPGTIATNIIPLCHGVGGCNNSKGGKLPERWLVENYGERKAKQITKRVQDYFDNLRQKGE